uniref:peptidylprolyl isomerase n=1 Tax=Flavobacterium sp. TaxID=239 RepID=UPI003751DFBC
MKLKFKILYLFFFGMIITNAQTKKITPKKATITKKVAIASVGIKPTINATKLNPNEGIFAEMETAKGKIVIQLEYKKTPVTVANFISLAEGTNPNVADKHKGKKFFDGLKFHRVIKDFMIQGGDPEGNGSGGPGYAFKDEFTDAKFDRAGILAMANSGANTNGSQFFITHKETSWLNGKHTIFGYVLSGQEVVNAIAQEDLITKVTIIRKGTEAKKFDAAKIFGDYFSNKAKEEEKLASERAVANAKALKEFENGKTTASGIKYIVLNEGTGASPTATSNV